MLHILLSRKIFLSGLTICVFLVVGSLVYHESVKRGVRKQERKTEQFLKRLKTQEVDRAAQNTEAGSSEDLEREGVYLTAGDTSETISEPAEMLSIDEVNFVDTGRDLFAEETAAIDNVLVSSYGVSPYGFGPYPEVPVGFPEHLMPVWTWSEEKLKRIVGRKKNFELMHRVLVELWNQGDQDFIGVSLNDQNGKVYPTYQNVMYVTDWVERENGTIRLPASFFGASDEDVHILT